ncbi:hypothetical protein [Hymenobacter cellulosivorans]|uniref:Uncharacterized protein n=1 Tax=Hymenobacter cellulosivorans TaxID=2932249 RepID=A0ABY4F8D7_9BACT|nr:hypothetical protein [Hymenobacter cellulosivorans]UOQ52184.1 hypothetical protein MUN80_20780 [Hymenobacter cellulosivorans]
MFLRHLPQTLILLTPVFFTACQSAPASAPPAAAAPVAAVRTVAAPAPSAVTVTTDAAEVSEETPADSASQEYATYFVVVADTSRSYPALRRRMLGLSRQYALGIDTLGRYFNVQKNRIILPENDEDEMYAGEYYPRRFPSHSLSLEYLNEYQEPAGAQTMALVTGIYQQEASADSALAVLGRADEKVFKLKSRIYVGCMH